MHRAFSSQHHDPDKPPPPHVRGRGKLGDASQTASRITTRFVLIYQSVPLTDRPKTYRHTHYTMGGRGDRCRHQP